MPARPTWTSWTPANSTAVWRCKPIRRSSPPSSPPPTITGGLLTILQQPDLIWYNPHLSCWERQAEGVDQGTKGGEAGLDGLDVREWDEREPGQEQARTDVGLQEQPEVVQVLLPAATRVPSGMGLQGSESG